MQIYLKTRTIKIETERFILRNILESDASERYLSWVQEKKTLEFIATAKLIKTIIDLKNYITTTVSKSDVLFLAIIDKKKGNHIGNIKYECINLENGYAIMGILIGDINYRGQGVASEVIMHSSKWLHDNLNIKKIILGVNKKNINAIRAYKKIGFSANNSEYIKVNSNNVIEMIWYLNL